MADLKYRGFQESDITDIVKIANLLAERDGEDPSFSEEMLQHIITMPMINPQDDFFTYIDDKNAIIGATLSMVNPRTGQAQAVYLLHPDCDESVYKPFMLEKSVARVREVGEREVPEDTPLYVMTGIEDKESNAYDRELYESEGFTENRRFYEMRIDLDTPIEQPAPLDGLELRPFDKDAHAHAVHAAQQESFRDHFGHAEDRPFDEWAHHFDAPNFDPTMWYIVWDKAQDEVAGFSLCEMHPAIDDMAEVGLLGVRRPWRKRGLGMYLLQVSFYDFQQRGVPRASLGVDAASKTNAVALYERAGMHVHKCSILYRKILRGNAEDIIE